MLTTIFAYNGTNTEILFYLMGVVGLYLSYITLKRYSVKSFWAFMELVFTLRHKYEYFGLENIPQSGGVLLLSNHVSWIDWMILQFPLEKPINYMMEKDIYYWKSLHPIFKKGEAIPLSPKASKDAFKEATERLRSGRVVGIFAEGGIAKDEKLGKFHRGYELIESDYEGVIIPIFIDGMDGSIFSRVANKHKKSIFSRRNIKVYFGEPISKTTKAEKLATIIQNMKEKYETK